jgi:hypothetical protein
MVDTTVLGRCKNVVIVQRVASIIPSRPLWGFEAEQSGGIGRSYGVALVHLSPRPSLNA